MKRRSRRKSTISSLDYDCFCSPCCPLDCAIHKHKAWDWGEGEVGYHMVPMRRGYMEEEEVQYRVEEEELPCEEAEAETTEASGFCTSGNILDRLVFDPSRHRRPYLCPWISHVRFENMIPEDIKNDHQYYASIQKTVLDSMCCLRVTSEPHCKKQGKIVATIGPELNTVEDIENAIQAGATLFRINMAYGDRCTQQSAIENIRTAANKNSARINFHIPIASIVDLKGPEIRTGKIHPHHSADPTKPEIFLKKDYCVKLTIDKGFREKCTPKVIYVDYEKFMEVVRPEMKVYLGDGAVKLHVNTVEERVCCCTITDGGFLSNYQQVHVPMVPTDIPPVTDIDIADIDWAIEQDVDFIALSRVRDGKTVKHLKMTLTERLLKARRCSERPTSVLAKISNYQGIENIDEIIEQADGIIIQRGDLGVEIPPEKVVIAQKMITAKCNMVGLPVFCSTQFLRSMLKRPRANRSEIQDIANCIMDGADGIVLSAETAVGDFPQEAIHQAHHVMREAVAATMQRSYFGEIIDKLVPAIEPKIAIALSAVQIATKIRASAIVVITTSGVSAKLVSWFRPRCIVIGVSRFGRTARQMNILRAIHPLHYQGPVLADWFQDVDQRFQYGIMYGKETCIIKSGDPLVLVSGYRREAGFTNCLRVVYASIKPGVYIEHPRDYYDDIITGKTVLPII